MDFGLSQEQQMLAESVTRLLRELSPLDHVRQVAEAGSAVSAQSQAALAELGLPGLVVPEAHGGLGMGLLDATVVATALGEAVAPVPFAARNVMAPLALIAAGSEAQQAQWLPRIAAGEVRFGVGVNEQVSRRDGSGVRCTGGQRFTALLDGTGSYKDTLTDLDYTLKLSTNASSPTGEDTVSITGTGTGSTAQTYYVHASFAGNQAGQGGGNGTTSILGSTQRILTITY